MRLLPNVNYQALFDVLESGDHMYENYLNTENAQKIADGIMKIIPCNINITDTAGEILASGDKSTLGNSSQRGADRAGSGRKPM